MRSLVTSIFLYACESWTLTAELQRRIQAMEMSHYRNILRISHKDHVTNKEVHAKIQQAIGPQEDLTMVKRCKLQWYDNVSHSSGRAKTIWQGTVKGGRRHGRQEEVGRQHQGMDRPGVHQVPKGRGEQVKMEETGCKIICGSFPSSLFLVFVGALSCDLQVSFSLHTPFSVLPLLVQLQLESHPVSSLHGTGRHTPDRSVTPLILPLRWFSGCQHAQFWDSMPKSGHLGIYFAFWVRPCLTLPSTLKSNIRS